MKLLINQFKISLFTMVVLAIANYSYVQGGILWQKEYGCGEGRVCSPGAAAFDETDNKLFIIGNSFKPVEGCKLWLWKINPSDGSKLADTVIMDIPEDCNGLTDSGTYLIRALEVTPDGNLITFTLGGFESDGSHVIKMNKDGQIIFNKPVEPDPEEETKTFNIIALADNSVMLQSELDIS